MHYTLDDFTNFLRTVDLNSYREQFSKIKTVEMDLPRNIQALDSIYRIYWNNDYTLSGSIPTYDEYYELYYKSCEENIKTFWANTGFEMDCQCFPKGLKARIYRTWASLITQIHAGYVAESVFGNGSVEQSTDLDHKDIDILAHYKGRDIKIQIKKESHRPEIGRMHKGMSAIEKEGIFNIWYVVPNPNEYLYDPYYKVKARKGELRDSLKSFIKYNPEEGTLDRLDNGFVIFTQKEFILIKEAIDSEN